MSRPNKGRLKNHHFSDGLFVFPRRYTLPMDDILRSGNFATAGQQSNQIANPLFHVAAVNDLVNRAFFQQEFGTLEAFRQSFAHGLLNHARAGKTD